MTVYQRLPMKEVVCSVAKHFYCIAKCTRSFPYSRNKLCQLAIFGAALWEEGIDVFGLAPWLFCGIVIRAAAELLNRKKERMAWSSRLSLAGERRSQTGANTPPIVLSRDHQIVCSE
eukprot:919805-Amphidinium_carterae.1